MSSKESRESRVRLVFRGAHWLDHWLQANLGRPYNALLSVGLTLEMLHRLQHLPDNWKPGAHDDPLGSIVAVVMEAALLIHQLGELHERAHARRARGAAAKTAKD